MESTDHQSLNHPSEKILQPGGHILMARYNREIVGTCALIKTDDDTYELAKMAVTERARGKTLVGCFAGNVTAVREQKSLLRVTPS